MTPLLAQKTVLVFFGLIGSGKSYVASSWAEHNGCLYLNTDVVRKQLVGLDPQSRRAEKAYAGLYSSVWTQKTYATMARRALETLPDPRVACIVLDGSYRQRCERDKLIDEFAQSARLAFIYCHCREETTKQRLALRARDPAAVSDGRWEIFVKQRELFDYPDDLDGKLLLDLDTEASLVALHRKIAAFLEMPL